MRNLEFWAALFKELGRDTERKRINTLDAELKETQYVIDAISERIDTDGFAWYLGERKTNRDLVRLRADRKWLTDNYHLLKAIDITGEIATVCASEVAAPVERFIGRVPFLDMEIVDSGNIDGVTLVIKGASYGNFGKDWDAAKRAAVRWFMLLRPDTFGKALYYRIIGSGGAYLEFGLFKSRCEKENITIPEDVGAVGFNRFIGYKGEPV